MWTWSLNWGQITPEIIIGTCPMTSNDLKYIQSKTGVSAALSLQHDDCLSHWHIDYDEMSRTAVKLNIKMLRCPIKDFDVTDMRRNLPKAVSLFYKFISEGHKTYVHCTAGMGRAPLTVLAYFIWLKELTPEDAIKIILEGRPEAVPSWEALYGAKEDIFSLHRGKIEKRAFKLYRLGVHNDPNSDWIQPFVDSGRWWPTIMDRYGMQRSLPVL